MLMEPRSLYRSRWFKPVFSSILGLLILGAFVAADDLGTGIAGLGMMVAVGFVFLIGGRRSETLAGLGGPGRDERWQMIDLQASAASGLVLITVVIGAWLYEIATGGDGSPYTALGAIAGVAYVIAVAVLRYRS